MGCSSSGQGVTPPDGPHVDAGLSQEVYDHILTEFASLDGNGDHKLSRAEFDNASKLPEFLGMSHYDVSHLFDRVDVDHNNSIDLKEFMAYMAKRKDHHSLAVQVAPEKKRLEENMSSLGFKLCTTDNGRLGVEGDGNCQFYSISWHLFSTTSRQSEVRSKIIEHLRGSAGADIAAFYAPELPSQPATFSAYLDEMAKDRVWGDQLTLQTAADVFNLRICTLTPARYDPNKAPASANVAGRSYGCVSTLLPQSSKGSAGVQAKDIWIGFAAQHYSPIQPSARTPKQLLGQDKARHSR